MDVVLGFLFDNKGNVALIRKRKPAWQAGRLNGIGGRVEKGETPLEAMRREFKEEAGCDDLEWRSIGLLWGSGYNMFLFSSRSGSARIKTTSHEGEVAWYSVKSLPPDIVGNLTWLVPLADYGLPVSAMIYHESPTA